ncbi:hypothetical protein [Roseiconus lacunae]|uniref:hypothetical protein n=1 Tax=Roseiconus lacunae TaxID=2605694 RepID=UPI001E30BB0A|nr:hypothetical protein [Roseiconus lacunae]MCD0460359.1 hypothetical protein [Roseiconus lacunae]
MTLIATSPGLPLIAIAIVAPTLLVLIGGAYRFANDSRQRVANLIAGFACSVIAIVALVLIAAPAPNSWAEDNLGWFVIGIAPVGAAIGLALAACYRRGVSDADVDSILAEPMQPGDNLICPKCLKWHALEFLRSRPSELQGEISTYRCRECKSEIEFAACHPPNAI